MILSWIKGYHLPIIRDIPQRDFAPSISMSAADCLVVQNEINRLLEIGAVEQCQPVAGQFISSVFLIKKSSRKNRLIFNLNTFLYASHFKMEDKNTAIRLLFPNAFMATIDLQDAYFSVKIWRPHFHSTSMSIELPLDKRSSLRAWLNIISSSRNCKIRFFARFVGKLTAACPAVKYGWLYMKLFERVKDRALVRSRGSYDGIMNIPSTLQEELDWWKTHLPAACNSIVPYREFYCEIFSDASNVGWGARCNGITSNREWNAEKKTFHINRLELICSLAELMQNVPVTFLGNGIQEPLQSMRSQFLGQTNLAFPPFSLILPVLQKTITEKAKLLLIVFPLA